MTCHPKNSFENTLLRRWKPICCHLIPSGGGVERALDYYRRMSQASRKGAAFDDCLHLARKWALGQTPVAERKARKRSSSNQRGLF
ncbi:TPA: type II toxin-antitoxin system VapC family toxin [Klebsiella michiganensis]|nr:type II toxin-antitoxin system VapC family toxin [Klebsiella michiganensis]